MHLLASLFDTVWKILDRYYPNTGENNLKFLSKLAQIFGKGLQLVGIFQPILQQVNPKAGDVTQIVSQDLTEILAATTDAEKIAVALPGTTGAQKLQIAIPLVSDIVLRSAALSNHKIANPDLYNQGISKLTSGAADIVNSLHPDGISVVSKSA